MNTIIRAVLDWLFGWAKDGVRDWQSRREARARGAAEEQARALRDAERLEADGRASAEEARQKSPDEGDGWERLD